MARIAIIGPGAIGGTVAAWLTHAGSHSVEIAARTPFAKLEVETPDGKALRSTPTVTTDPKGAKAADWVLVATKAYDFEGTVTWFGSLAPKDRRPATRFAILQNGVEHIERFASHVPAERIVPVVVECPAERSAPGIIRQRRKAVLTVPDDANGRDFAALFAGTDIECTLAADWKSVAWWKLCVNSAGVLSGILVQPSGVMRRDDIADIARGIVRECAAVGRAEGAKLSDGIAEEVVQRYRGYPPDSVNSLHGDRIAGRRTEIDARNRVIVRLGQKHGIPTPYNEMAVALIAAATAGN